MTVTGIVLAGGASSRFGGDKLAAPLEGRPVLHHALERVAAVAERIVVVLAPGVPEPALPRDLLDRIAFARDAETYGGPLAGLAAGLAAVGGPPDAVALVVGGDMPRLEPAVLRLLVDAIRPGVDAAALVTDPPSALPMAVRVGPAAAAADSLLAGERRRLRGLLEVLPSALVASAAWRAIDLEGETLVDIDARDDLPG